MIFWIDAQLPPQLARWLNEHFGVEAVAVRDIGLRDASDTDIFAAAKEAAVTVITKDSDFRDLLERLGPPPQVVWITCGNTSNARLELLFQSVFARVLAMIAQDEPLIEISG